MISTCSGWGTMFGMCYLMDERDKEEEKSCDEVLVTSEVHARKRGGAGRPFPM